MVWIRVEQSLATHRKTIIAASKLNIETPQMIGHLISFWGWAYDNAPTGRLDGEIVESLIATAAGWPVDDAQAFVEALVSAKFLDRIPRRKTGYLIHNWSKYTGGFIARRQQDKLRMREKRAAEATDREHSEPE
jgi:hypothetical protein